MSDYKNKYLKYKKKYMNYNLLKGGGDDEDVEYNILEVNNILDLIENYSKYIEYYKESEIKLYLCQLCNCTYEKGVQGIAKAIYNKFKNAYEIYKKREAFHNKDTNTVLDLTNVKNLSSFEHEYFKTISIPGTVNYDEVSDKNWILCDFYGMYLPGNIFENDCFFNDNDNNIVDNIVMIKNSNNHYIRKFNKISFISNKDKISRYNKLLKILYGIKNKYFDNIKYPSFLDNFENNISKIETYEQRIIWFDKCLNNFISKINNLDFKGIIIIVIPLFIGAGLAGGNPKKYHETILSNFKNINKKCKVYFFYQVKDKEKLNNVRNYEDFKKIHNIT